MNDNRMPPEGQARTSMPDGETLSVRRIGASRENILARIVDTKRSEIARLTRSVGTLRDEALARPPARDFEGALAGNRRVSLIAEIKRRSPGAGVIDQALDPVTQARAYAAGGAAALSVLTDREYFSGSLDDLRAVRATVPLPILRKDFVLDESQIWEARAAGADAILLIVRILDDRALRELRGLAESLGMGVLVEAHDRDEVERALSSGARILGINNRDLSTFMTDVDVTLGLLDGIPPWITLVSESGISDQAQVRRVAKEGVQAILVGEALVRAPDPAGLARELSSVPRALVPRRPVAGSAARPEPRARPLVKICGLTNVTDARLARDAGADLVGAVLVEGSPRCVTAEEAYHIREAAGRPLVLVTADQDPDQLARLAKAAGASALQLHGSEPVETVAGLRERGDWELWKAVRVRNAQDIVEALDAFGERVDMLLLDGWHAGQLGGTGTRFPWKALEEIATRLPAALRIGVAGGLASENVAEAIHRMQPDLVDVSSGVEATPGQKDPGRLRDFVRASRTY
jgi:indole-3-glycerol phosphate synthase / phosphoribosylanthranilate isomerase